jgi:hypothetical protein
MLIRFTFLQRYRSSAAWFRIEFLSEGFLIPSDDFVNLTERSAVKKQVHSRKNWFLPSGL